MQYNSEIKTIAWVEEENLSRMIDQKIIPHKFEFFDAKTCEQMYVAIKDMIVRGAPAIGIAGAHGVVLAALELQKQNLDFQTFKIELTKKADYLKSSRPTAVNLAWALEKQMGVLNTCSSIDEAIKKLTENGIKVENEDIEINKKIGEYGATLVPKKGATIPDGYYLDLTFHTDPRLYLV